MLGAGIFWQYCILPIQKYLFAHPVYIKPFPYSIGTLHDCNLRDSNHTNAFGRMLRRKLQERQRGDITWPLTPEESLSRIDTGHWQEIHSAIHFSIYEFASIN